MVQPAVQIRLHKIWAGDAASGGYARYVAIAPPSWGEGVSVTEVPGVPLARQTAPLKRDENGVFRPTP